jgi:2-methylcitrate dehydratase
MSGGEIASLEEAGTIGALARWVRDPGPIRQASLDHAALLVLDTLGCGIAGLVDPLADIVRDFAAGPGDARCSLIGGGRAGLTSAAFANGVMVRLLDLNDYLINEVKGQPSSGGHPSDNIPVALAVGEAQGSSGRDVLAAIVMGYELYARLQGLMDRHGLWDGVTVSGLVAPAMAGRLMGFSEETLAHALALGLARAATPRAVRSGDLSAAKNIANAQVAESGLAAALLAQRGVTGPLAILDQKEGLGSLFAEEDARTVLSAPLAAESCVDRAKIKAYPSLATSQAAVTAALELHRALGSEVARIAKLDFIMADYPILRRQAADPGRLDPQSKESADHSFPFLIAVALIDGALGLAQYDNDRWHDPKVRALMAKISMGFDPDWVRRAPQSYPASLTVHLEDGGTRRAEVPYAPGAAPGGVTADAVIEKFHRVADRLGAAARERVIAEALGLAQAASPQRLLQLLATA